MQHNSGRPARRPPPAGRGSPQFASRKPMRRVAFGFIAGFLATIIFHQIALALLHAAGLMYIEEWQEVDEIVAAGYDRPLVEKILRMVDTNEFTTAGSADHPRVDESVRSGRQMPIAQRWRREPARFVR